MAARTAEVKGTDTEYGWEDGNAKIEKNDQCSFE
jgi:hypothetical protein